MYTLKNVTSIDYVVTVKLVHPLGGVVKVGLIGSEHTHRDIRALLSYVNGEGEGVDTQRVKTFSINTEAFNLVCSSIGNSIPSNYMNYVQQSISGKGIDPTDIYYKKAKVTPC